MTRSTLRSALGPIVVVFSLLLTGPAGASVFQGGDDVRVSPLHHIDDDLYAATENLIVEGQITGDLVAAAAQSTITGTVDGSVNLASRYTNHDGNITGSLRWLGERLTMNGQVGRSIVAAGSHVIINQGAVVERDLTVSAGQIDMSGVVRGDAKLTSERIRISGRIEGDADLKAGHIVISPPAIITGILTYEAEKEDLLEIEPGATVAGEIVWQPPKSDDDENAGSIISEIAFRLASLLAAFIFGIIMFALVRPYAEEAYSALMTRTVASLAAGLLTLVGLILAGIIMILALLGTLIGTLLLSGDLAVLGLIMLVLSILMVPISSFATVSGAVALYSGKIVVGLYLGSLMWRRSRDRSNLSRSALFIGLVILTLAAALPYVGLAVVVVTAIVGSGAIMLGIQTCRRNVSTKRDEGESASGPVI